MAEHSLICSRVSIQSQPHALAAIRAWVTLKAILGHSRSFFGAGLASLPVEPCKPTCPVFAGTEVRHV
jgi:hypothetical protein